MSAATQFFVDLCVQKIHQTQEDLRELEKECQLSEVPGDSESETAESSANEFESIGEDSSGAGDSSPSDPVSDDNGEADLFAFLIIYGTISTVCNVYFLLRVNQLKKQVPPKS